MKSPPPTVISSSLLQVYSVLVEGLLGTLKRTDGGAQVVPEVALDRCVREDDEPSHHGVPKKNWGYPSSFLQLSLSLWQVLFGQRWHR